MDRRAILTGLAAGLLAAPRGAGAQPATKMHRVGFLGTAPVTPTTQPLWDAFVAGLREHGYVEGQNLVIERRYSEGKAERFAEFAAEFVRLKVDVIVAPATPAARAAKQATSTIPIITILVGDPVATGLAASLARPGGNLTGLTAQATDWSAKQLQLLTDVAPGRSRVAILWNPANPAHPPGVKEIEAAARALHVQIRLLEVRSAGDLDTALAELTRDPPAGLMVFDDQVTFVHRRRIIDVAASSRIPAIYSFGHYVHAGGLMAYSPSLAALFRRAGYYVDRVLKGTKPANLPIEQPSKFELVINLRTAKALGLTIPPSVLARADEVIE